eukprot:Clim_evm26s149 gene=Clim_evmTU26s149
MVRDILQQRLRDHALLNLKWTDAGEEFWGPLEATVETEGKTVKIWQRRLQDTNDLVCFKLVREEPAMRSAKELAMAYAAMTDDDFLDFDYEVAKRETVHDVSEGDDNLRVFYMASNLPWPLSNRDMVVGHGLFHDLVDGVVVISEHSVDDLAEEERPEGHNGHVRCHVATSSWIFKDLPTGGCQIIRYMSFAPNGYIPNRLASSKLAGTRNKWCKQMAVMT